MAIRLGSPSGLARLRLQWQATRNHLQRHTRAWQNEWASLRTKTRDWCERAGGALSNWNLQERALQRQREQRLAQLALFAEKYEDLIDLLCLCAHEGVQTKGVVRYAELRNWMQTHYALLRPRLRGFFTNSAHTYDPFECLFAPQDLNEVINDLSGIENMTLTRDILDAYRASLTTPETMRKQARH